MRAWARQIITVDCKLNVEAAPKSGSVNFDRQSDVAAALLHPDAFKRKLDLVCTLAQPLLKIELDHPPEFTPSANVRNGSEADIHIGRNRLTSAFNSLTSPSSMNSNSSGISRQIKRASFSSALSLLHLVPVRLLHDEDEVSPSHKFGRQGILSIGIGARGIDVDARMSGEGLLGSWTPQPVLAANEEDVHPRDVGGAVSCSQWLGGGDVRKGWKSDIGPTA
jgi:hypothetical protein